jgi:peptidoglycan/LPS O-acetylase OafA/YrhL
MLMLGKSSYAAYMVHGPLQLIVYKFVPFALVAESPVLVKVAAAFAYPALMVGAGIAAHILFEHPARAFIVRRLRATIHGPDRSA